VFDAGSIESRLTVDTSKFDSDLDRAKAKVKVFEDERHTVKISAVFDSSATARARQVFARLDQQLSADALARMRTSPQGSVLGSLNALLAPQSLQQGSLGNITRAGGTAGGTVARDVTTTDRVNTVGLPVSNSITTQDRVNVTGLPTSGGTIVTTDKVELDESSAAEVKAELDAIGSKKETVTVKVDGAAAAAAELAAVSAAEKDAGSSSQSLLQRLSSSVTGLVSFGGAAKDAGAKSESLGEQLGFLGTPMGALAVAGTALAPVIVTAGVGIGGFGAAAVGAVKPILDAAQATGGLQGNLQTLDPAQQQAARGLLALEDQYSSFSKALAPEVFQVFNTGLKTAGTLLGDVAPVAKSAGQGINSVLKAVNADLNSAQWKQFFTWMAQNAGPDIQMLGTTIGAVVNDLPPLLEALQPVATGFLGIATDAAKAVGALENFEHIAQQANQAADQSQKAGGSDPFSLGGIASSAKKAAEQLLGSLFPGFSQTTSAAAQFAKSQGDAAAASAKQTEAARQQAAAQQAAVTAATDLSTNLTTLEARYGLTAGQAQALVTAAGQTDKALQGSGNSAAGAMSAIFKYADASLKAVTPSQQLAGAISILNNNTLGATLQLDAFTQAWNILVGNSVSDQQAVLNTAQAFDTYNSTVKQSGTNSTAAQQAFLGIIQSMGTGLSTLEKNGATVDQLNSFYQTNIDKLNSLHGLTPQQQADVEGITRDYDVWANSTDGLNNKLLTAAGTIKDQFTVNLKALGEYTPTVQSDIDNLSNSILKTGTQSSATAGDRAKLIADLKQSGIESDTATKLVDGLIKKLGSVPKSVSTDVHVTGSGSGTITFAEQNIKNAQTGFLEFHAAGGPVTGSGGPTSDSVPIMASAGEYVIQASSVARYGLPVMDAINAGKFAAGGLVDITQFVNAPSWMLGVQANASKSAEQTMAMAMLADMKAKLAAAAAAAGPGGGTPSANAALAKKLYPAYATGPVWDAWNAVAMAESGWNQFATNPTSGAYGIPQALPFTKMPKAAWPASAGGSSNPTAQIEWMWNYMAATYGGPIGAAAHEAAYHWYKNGGVINEPVLGRGLRSGARYVLGEAGSEMVTPIGGTRGGGTSMDDLAGKLDEFNANMRRLIQVTSQVPAGVGRHVGGAINGAASDASFRSRYPRGGA
jgi:hypothetical protein